MKRRQHLQCYIPKRTKTLYRKMMWGGKYGTVNDIRGECSAASTASSHQQSAIERSCSEDLEEDSYLKKRQEQPQEDDSQNSMTESESEFQFSEDKEDNMVPENDRIDTSKDCSEEEGSYVHLMKRQEQPLDDDNQSSMSEDSESEFQFSEGKGDNMVPDSQYDRPLYPGTNLTIYEYHVKVFQFALKHNLTKHAYGDLLNLIQSVLPSSNSAITSLFKLNSLFSNLIDPNKVIHHHKYCSFCHHLMMKTDDVNGKCPNGCDDTIDEFMICDIEIQIKSLMSDPFVWNSLQSRFRNDAKLSNIFGGTEYRKLMEPEQFLSKPENITFCLNTDGVAVFKSSTAQIWPIWLQINELSPKMRFSKKYLILAGIWFSKDKPTMESYMHPLVEKVNELYYDGVDVDTPIGKRKAHAAIIVCSTDRPACALVANNMQYNGHFGCTTCDSYGTSVGRTVYWPYDDASNLRTHQSILSSALEAVQCRKPVQGIKGVPILSLHPPFNLVKGMAVDDLHCVDLGVVKALCTHWFSADKRGQPYNIYEKIDQCNESLLKIKVPNVIRRRPRSLHLISKWKGSEFQSWLLYYSIPILKDVLPAQYFDHYLLLVVSMYILRGNCVTEFELELSEACLNHFYVQFTDLYGITSTTMNVHLLTHLPFYVRAWGPLWTTSCYCFESANGTLRKFFHGTRNMSKQILYSFSMFQLLSHLKPSVNSARSLIHTKETAVILGTAQQFTKYTSQDELEAMHININGLTLQSCDCEIYLRVSFRNEVYHSTSYTRASMQNSYTVMYHSEDSCQFGEINYFLTIRHQTFGEIINAIITPFDTSTAVSRGTFESVQKYINSKLKLILRHQSTKISVDVSHIICKCISIKIGEDEYLALFANNFCDIVN